MKEKKINLSTIIIFGVTFLLLLVGGVLMVYFDLQIGQKITEQAALCAAEEITHEAFVAYLNSQNPIRFVLTIGGVAVIGASVTFCTFFVKKLVAFIKARRHVDR